MSLADGEVLEPGRHLVVGTVIHDAGPDTRELKDLSYRLGPAARREVRRVEKQRHGAALTSVAVERLYQRPQHVERGLLGRWLRFAALFGVPREGEQVLAGELVKGAPGQPLSRPPNVAQRQV